MKANYKLSQVNKDSFDEGFSIFSNPNLFYINNESQQKVVNISNLPPELQHNNYQFADISRLEGHAEQQRRFIESLLMEDENISNTLHGIDPPHYRTDSVEYNPGVTSHIGSFEGHSKTLSEDFQGQVPEHTRKFQSFGGFSISPPPGFRP